MLATPAVSQADQGRQRAAGHPVATVTAEVAPATHLCCRDREATRPPAESEARSSEDEELVGPVRSGAVLLRVWRNGGSCSTSWPLSWGRRWSPQPAGPPS